jgi:hypothetical protein
VAEIQVWVQACDLQNRYFMRNYLLRLALVHSVPIFLALIGMGCTSTTVARRPLAEGMLAKVKEAIEGREAMVELAYEPERAVEHEREVHAAERQAREACQSALGQGILSFGENCHDTQQCECGLTCQSGRCLGTSLKNRSIPSLPAAKSLEVRDVRVGRDTMQWLGTDPGASDARWRSIPTAAVKRVSIVSRQRGFLDGFGVGFLAGGALGGLFGLQWAEVASQGTRRGGAADFLRGSVLVGLPTGLLLGLVGAAIGHRTIIEFDDSALAAPSPAARTPEGSVRDRR